MDIPNSLRNLMQKDHDVRVFVSHVLKENNELKERIKNIEAEVKEMKSYIWKPKRQASRPRKPGPPKGHKPHNRPIPKKIHRKSRPEMDECPGCGGGLSGPVRTRKRYVEDISPPEPFNTEYEIPYYWCRRCGKQVSPKPADVIPRCRFGTRLMLLMTFMRYGLLLPFNKMAKELEIVYGISMSEGCMVDSLSRFAGFLGPEFGRIKEEVRKLAVVNVDETGWRINGKNVWLWDFITDRHELLVIDRSRGSDVPKNVLGDNPWRVVGCDCYSAYDKLGGKQQKCWSHLLRYTRNLDSPEGELLHARLKRIHELAKTGAFSAEELLHKIDALKSAGFRDSKCVRMLNRLERHRVSLFTFVDNPNVPDNNNAAERGLRRSVVMRKITGGNRTHKGAGNHQVIMSIMQTWEKQGVDFFDRGMEIIQQNLP